MDKPLSLSVKDFLIRKLAVDMMIPETTILSVITHEFGVALDALSCNNTVEISGFGRFTFNMRRAKARMEKYIRTKNKYEQSLSTEISKQHRKTLELKLASVTRDIASLKPKLNENTLG